MAANCPSIYGRIPPADGIVIADCSDCGGQGIGPARWLHLRALQHDGSDLEVPVEPSGADAADDPRGVAAPLGRTERPWAGVLLGELAPRRWAVSGRWLEGRVRVLGGVEQLGAERRYLGGIGFIGGMGKR